MNKKIEKVLFWGLVVIFLIGLIAVFMLYNVDLDVIGPMLIVFIPFIIGVVIGAIWQKKKQDEGKTIGGPHYVGLPGMLGLAIGLFLVNMLFG
ncbi:MAG: hypothetical protein IJO70_00010 [Lachnospiraceae bacterium]|nr:hypothetical protein [Lachnospiraceae bacterium]